MALTKMADRKPARTPSREAEAVVRAGMREKKTWRRAKTVENRISQVSRFCLEMETGSARSADFA